MQIKIFFFISDLKLKEKVEIAPITIHHLNIDCLLEIIHRLPILDRIRIERLSKRWNELIKRSYNYFHDLIIDRRNLALKKSDNSSEIDIVRKILTKCGRFLKNVRISSTLNSNLQIIIADIANYCQEIVILNITYNSKGGCYSTRCY